MAGLKRSGDSRDDRNGKRSKVKTGGVPPKKSGPAPKSFVKAGKSDKNGKSKKVVEPEPESEDEDDDDDDDDEFDIDNVSDKDVDMDDGEDDGEDDELDVDGDEDMDEEMDEGDEKKPKSMMTYPPFLRRVNTDHGRLECIARVAREAKSPATRAQSVETQRRYNLAIETAMGATPSQVARAAGGAQETDCRAFRDHRRPGQGICVQARFGACGADGAEVREHRAAQADCARAEG